MRIALSDPESGLYPLAGTEGLSQREHSGAAGFELTAESLVQVQQFIRASHSSELDRGNLLRRLTFSTTRLFSTAAEASLWALSYDNEVPREGTLIIQNIDPNGDVQSTVQIADALVRPPVRRLNGCTLELTYTCTGAALTVTTGTPPVYWNHISRNWENL